MKKVEGPSINTVAGRVHGDGGCGLFDDLCPWGRQLHGYTVGSSKAPGLH